MSRRSFFIALALWSVLMISLMSLLHRVASQSYLFGAA